MRNRIGNGILAARATVLGFAIELPLVTCLALAFRYSGDSALSLVLFVLHYIPSFILYVLQEVTAGGPGNSSPFASLLVSYVVIYFIQSALISIVIFMVLKARSRQSAVDLRRSAFHSENW